MLVYLDAGGGGAPGMGLQGAAVATVSRTDRVGLETALVRAEICAAVDRRRRVFSRACFRPRPPALPEPRVFVGWVVGGRWVCEARRQKDPSRLSVGGSFIVTHSPCGFDSQYGFDGCLSEGAPRRFKNRRLGSL